MEDNKKKIESKSQKEILDEIKQLSARANELDNSEQLGLFPEIDLGEDDVSFDSSIINDTADPERSHRLYYNIRSLMIQNLPKGNENKRLRDIIYHEKNLFLNRGIDIDTKTGVRGSDGRQTYISNFLDIAFDTTASWVKNGGTPFDLYIAFLNLNKERGYRANDEPQK